MTDLKCEHGQPPHLPYIADHADARRRLKRGEHQYRCSVCGRWVWTEFWEKVDSDQLIDPEGFTLLCHAVETIVAGERAKFPDRGDDTFWDEFRVVLLADVIKRHKELLSG